MILTVATGLVLVRLHRYRRRFMTILNHSNYTKSRFFRLFLLALLLVIFFVPLEIYVLYLNLMSSPRQSYSWKRLHGPLWNFILKVPTSGVVQFDRWIPVAMGILLFMFFGLGNDAVAMYRGWAQTFKIEKYLPHSVMGVINEKARNCSTTSEFMSASWIKKSRAAVKKRFYGSLDGSIIAGS